MHIYWGISPIEHNQTPVFLHIIACSRTKGGYAAFYGAGAIGQPASGKLKHAYLIYGLAKQQQRAFIFIYSSSL